MKLVVGGTGAGKEDFVKNAWNYQDCDISSDVFGGCPIVCDLQDIELSIIEDCLPILLKKDVVICQEIGCGIVPIDRYERERRESIGRLCVLLAKEAETVVRVFCGIATAIKGDI